LGEPNALLSKFLFAGSARAVGEHPLRTCPFWSAQSRRNDYAHPRTAMISVV